MKTCPPCHGNCHQGRECPQRAASLASPAQRPSAAIRFAARALRWAIAIALTLGILALCAALDAAPDAREETANAQALQDAQQQAAQEQRKEIAAYQACKTDHDPNVLVAWNFEGQLICQPKRGPARIVTAQSAIK